MRHFLLLIKNFLKENIYFLFSKEIELILILIYKEKSIVVLVN